MSDNEANKKPMLANWAVERYGIIQGLEVIGLMSALAHGMIDVMSMARLFGLLSQHEPFAWIGGWHIGDMDAFYEKLVETMKDNFYGFEAEPGETSEEPASKDARLDVFRSFLDDRLSDFEDADE